MNNPEYKSPDFWRICFTDAYLFRFAYIYTPLLSLLLIYNAAGSRPGEYFILPGIMLVLFLGTIFFRYTMIRSAFKSTIELKSRIDEYSPAGGLLKINILVVYSVQWNGENFDQTACLSKFSPRVKKLRKGEVITVLWNPDKNISAIKEAYIDT